MLYFVRRICFPLLIPWKIHACPRFKIMRIHDTRALPIKLRASTTCFVIDQLKSDLFFSYPAIKLESKLRTTKILAAPIKIAISLVNVSNFTRCTDRHATLR